jgi:transcriptional regulator CtsR
MLSTKIEIEKMNIDEKRRTLTKLLKEKYKKDILYNCSYCAINLLFDTGYISEEELNEQREKDRTIIYEKFCKKIKNI